MEAAPWAGSLEALIYNAAGSGLRYFQPLPRSHVFLQRLPSRICGNGKQELWHMHPSVSQRGGMLPHREGQAAWICCFMNSRIRDRYEGHMLGRRVSSIDYRLK